MFPDLSKGVLFLCMFHFAISTFIGNSEVKNDKSNHLKFNPSRKDQVRADIDVSNALQALEKIVFYYSKSKREATVDFTFGLRMAEGEIARLLHMSDIGAYPIIAGNPALQKHLKSLLENLESTIKQALPFVERRNKRYYLQFYDLIKEKWTSYQLPPQDTYRKDLDIFPNTTIDGEERLEEKESDECMSTLLGDDIHQPCSVDVCWEKMTAESKSMYYPTHQILWLMVGDKLGCRDKMESLAIKSGYLGGIEEIFKRKCAGIIIEMEAIMQDGVRMSMIDLFLEQGAICGGMGFIDAIRPGWLQKSFQWQDPNTGCFLDVAPDDFQDEIREYKFWIKYKREQWKSRNLLVDSVLTDGCSTHTTGVAAAFFATSLRLFFDPFYKNSQLDPYVRGVPQAVVGQSRNLHTIFLIVLLVITSACIAICVFKRRWCVSFYGLFLRRYCQRIFFRYKGISSV
ncbi:UPF0764 protein C16orf89 homolog isoform X1 [Clavelina lepadiformis]|uniref:UPF0764 protein C16orf89 homolog isoform X1 n=1 Tax=Clavelina lepadiformis TaxID=159417 RepID=UPI0040425824